MIFKNKYDTVCVLELDVFMAKNKKRKQKNLLCSFLSPNCTRVVCITLNDTHDTSSMALYGQMNNCTHDAHLPKRVLTMLLVS